jgi:hypothetical protein
VPRAGSLVEQRDVTVAAILEKAQIQGQARRQMSQRLGQQVRALRQVAGMLVGDVQQLIEPVMVRESIAGSFHRCDSLGTNTWTYFVHSPPCLGIVVAVHREGPRRRSLAESR